jgi:hypothetical protein
MTRPKHKAPRVLHRPPGGWPARKPSMIDVWPVYALGIVYAATTGTAVFGVVVTTLETILATT